MAKTKKNSDAKSVTTATGTGTTKAKRARPAAGKAGAKKGATKAKAAPKAAKARSEGRLLQLVRSPLERVSYLRRTVEILRNGARKRAKLREAQVRQLEKVWQDLQADVQSGLEGASQATRDQLAGVAEQIRETRVVKEVTELPERVTGRVTERLDELLDRVGLVRKAIFQETVGRKALPVRAVA